GGRDEDLAPQWRGARAVMEHALHRWARRAGEEPTLLRPNEASRPAGRRPERTASAVQLGADGRLPRHPRNASRRQRPAADPAAQSRAALNGPRALILEYFPPTACGVAHPAAHPPTT